MRAHGRRTRLERATGGRLRGTQPRLIACMLSGTAWGTVGALAGASILLISAELEDAILIGWAVLAFSPFLCFPVSALLALWFARPPVHKTAIVGMGVALGVLATIFAGALCIGCYAVVAFIPAVFGGASVGVGVACASSRELQP